MPTSPSISRPAPEQPVVWQQQPLQQQAQGDPAPSDGAVDAPTGGVTEPAPEGTDTSVDAPPATDETPTDETPADDGEGGKVEFTAEQKDAINRIVQDRINKIKADEANARAALVQERDDAVAAAAAAKDAADKAAADLAAATTAANAARLDAAVTAAAMAAGVPAEKVAYVAKLADVSAVFGEDGTLDTGKVTGAVAAVVADLPGLTQAPAVGAGPSPKPADKPVTLEQALTKAMGL